MEPEIQSTIAAAVIDILYKQQALSSGTYNPIHARIIVSRVNRNLAAYKILQPLNERRLRETISELRKQGHPIVSGTFGYMISRNPEVIMHCAKLLRNAGNEQLRMSKILRDLAAQQKTLFS